MGRINYFFEEIEKRKTDLPAKKWLKSCLKNEGWELGCLNFIFCSDAYLKKINIKYLKKDYLTDVISFKNEINQGKKNEHKIIFGDIFISLERVKENQITYKTSFRNELKRVIIHGVLHLIGYKDAGVKEKEIMTSKENLYINIT